MTEETAEFRERIKRHLREQHADGVRFTKSKQIAEELGVSSQRVGRHTNALQAEGCIERRGSERNVATWAITVDEGGESDG